MRVRRRWGLRCTNGGRQRIQPGGGEGYTAAFGLWDRREVLGGVNG